MADKMDVGFYPFFKIREKVEEKKVPIKDNPNIIDDMLVGDSDIMVAVKKKIADFSKIPAPVLITGESGTGKDVAARLIHKISNVSGRYVAVNCAAIPEGLLESELFGHVKGAFTGAVSDRVGKLEYANNGVLFLDEIGDIPVSTQVKILRAIETKSIEPVGSNTSQQASFRLVCATNKDIGFLMKEKLFREDLFYRINTLVIHMPSLRSMSADVGKIFVSLFAMEREKLGLKHIPLTRSALNFLEKYEWPGNVRQLNNLTIALSTFDGDTIGVEALARFVDNARGKKRDSSKSLVGRIVDEYYDLIVDKYRGSLRKFSRDLEGEVIKKCLKDKGNNKLSVSEFLGIGRTFLYDRINNDVSKYFQRKNIGEKE